MVFVDLFVVNNSFDSRQHYKSYCKYVSHINWYFFKDIDCGAQIARIKKRLDDIEARVEELEKKKQIAASGSCNS